MSETLDHVHVTREEVAVAELTPPHPPREETPEYARAHRFLVHEKRAPCESCGVNIDTLSDPQRNPYGATAIETHHYPIERSLMDACDPVKVHRDFPQVYDRATLAAFVDTPANLKVLCSACHRSPGHGIHHLLSQDWIIQRYLLDSYQVAATLADVTQALAHDEQVEHAAGIETTPEGQTPS